MNQLCDLWGVTPLTILGLSVPLPKMGTTLAFLTEWLGGPCECCRKIRSPLSAEVTAVPHLVQGDILVLVLFGIGWCPEQTKGSKGHQWLPAPC